MSGISKYKAIVMGASAGGLAAISFILEELPANYPLPILLVQHRIKDQRQLLEEILQTKCRLKIKQADEKEPIRAGTVYIAPPDYHLLLEHNHTLSLNNDKPVCFSRPSIDVLFESAADACKTKLIAIILTGANSDGARGTAAVKKMGGLTIAQDPEEAEYPFMPNAALGQKGVVHTWKLKEIRDFLLNQRL